MAPQFENLQAVYSDLWQRMEVRPNRTAAVDQIASRLLASKSRYQAVTQSTRVPWFVIAALHNRESDADFKTYLGNGEPLSRTTRLVPRGRGPFASWEAGAIDALGVDGLDRVTSWSPERACYEIEKFNGFGYRNRHPPVNSPYLWSFSNNYQSGKYVADNRFDPSAVDAQCGAIPIIKRIMALDPSAVFNSSGGHAPDGPAAALAFGSRGDRVTQLQNALKQRGYAVGDVDGIYGTLTRDAVTSFQRDANLPATGIADDKTTTALAHDHGPIIVNGGTVPPMQPVDVLRILIQVISNLAPARSAASGGASAGSPSSGMNVLQQLILAAFRPTALAPASTLSAQTTSALPPSGSATVLSPIDNMLGGEALAGKKTALAIVAYVLVAILQAVGVVGTGTPSGLILNTLIGGVGGLGVLSKFDRIIQLLGVVARKPSS